MINRPHKHVLLPLLALSFTLAAVTVHAQTSATLQVRFGTAPHWTSIRGTRVEEIPQAERPDYDMFRISGTYYAYNNNRWYSSTRQDGNFTMIDDRYVPNELSTVPRDHWRRYPSNWDNNRSQGQDNSYGSRGQDNSYSTLQVNFRRAPRWMAVRGTRVRELRMRDRPDYDMFGYGGSYYVYSNDRWYTSRNWRGQFILIQTSSVPAELSRVPRNHWRNYPSQWTNRYDNGRNNRGRGHQQGNYSDNH